jgi:hypothetical protein
MRIDPRFFALEMLLGTYWNGRLIAIIESSGAAYVNDFHYWRDC